MKLKTPCFLQHCTTSGLCNRLRAWAAIGGLADMQNESFYVRWEAVQACPAVFEELFVPNEHCHALSSVPRPMPKGVRYYVGPKGNFAATSSIQMYANQLPTAELSAKLRVASRERRSKLQLRPRLQKQIDEFCSTLPKDVIGIHVRRTDLPKTYYNDDAMFQAVELALHRNPDQQFLLCADNLESVKVFQTRYGDRIIWRSCTMRTDLKRRERATPISEAVIDVWALSRTSRIIGTAHSSFSSFAGWLGDVPVERL